MSTNEQIGVNETLKSATPNQRLLSIRSELRLTREYICDKYELSTETLRAWETGKLNLSEKAIKRCIDIYRNEGVILSKSWLLTGEGLNPQMSFEVGKYFSSIEELDEQQKEHDEFLMIQEANFFKNTTKNATILLVTNEEMCPMYAPGDYVGGRICGKEKTDACLGKDCIIITKSGQKYFRRLSKSLSDNTYNLACLNPSWGATLEPVIFDVEIENISPVIWHRRPE